MKVLFHNSFHKSYNKRVKNNAKLAAKAQERTRLFELKVKKEASELFPSLETIESSTSHYPKMKPSSSTLAPTPKSTEI